MHIYILDNYDSFTYNLYQYIGEILTSARNKKALNDFTLTVKRNDEVSLTEIEAAGADRLIISPGPGSCLDQQYFGVCSDVIKTLGKSVPLLGVCLGMQGIVHGFGGHIIKAPLPMHGKVSPIHHTETGIFSNIPNHLSVMRYHSLIASDEDFPDCLEVTATVGDITPSDFAAGKRSTTFEIMAVQHRHLPITGIQFHPESFATEGGRELISNFLFQV